MNSREPPSTGKQRIPPPHPTHARQSVEHDNSESAAGEEDPGAADEELRDTRPGRESD